MDDARHLQALRGVASIVVGSPHRAPCADLRQRGGICDVPVVTVLFTRFSRGLSRRADRQRGFWVARSRRDTGGGRPALATRCRTPPEWALGGGFFSGLQIGSCVCEGVWSGPRPNAPATHLFGAPPVTSKAPRKRMARTTSRRSRMPTSLAIVNSALRSADTR